MRCFCRQTGNVFPRRGADVGPSTRAELSCPSHEARVTRSRRNLASGLHVRAQGPKMAQPHVHAADRWAADPRAQTGLAARALFSSEK